MSDAATGRAVADRVAALRGRIEAAARRAGRAASEVTLVGVSKRQPLARIAAAVRAGVDELGENYVQEARDKQAALLRELGPDAPAPRWCLVGHLQRNKARLAVELFHLIETVDDARLARELDRRAAAAGRGSADPLPVLLQVNLSGEPQKSGVPADGLGELLAACAPLEAVRAVGLMTVPAADPDPERSRPAFAQLRALRDRHRAEPGGLHLRELSMGMSADFEVAIEEGATRVRVGTALFGPREDRT